MMIIDKGKITGVKNNGKIATVTPYAGGSVSPELTVPFFLIGALPIGMPVVYIVFDDNTGCVLCRLDGEWNHEITNGLKIDGISFASHTHEYIPPGGGTSQTGIPE